MTMQGSIREEMLALHDIKRGELVSASPEITYETCRNQQKEFGNYDRCDRCQFRFKCWTADKPTTIDVTSFGSAVRETVFK